MALDPFLERMLADRRAAGTHGGPSPSVAELRAAMNEDTSSIALMDPPDATVEITDQFGPADVPVRIYRPADLEVPAPTLVYCHGGGWWGGTLPYCDSHLTRLAAGAQVLVVSVDYRLAPEHPFPAGLMDCYSVICWLAESGHEIGADPARLAIGGDSAGGNLAAAVAILARDRGGPAIGFQLLEEPSLDLTADAPIPPEVDNGYGLDRPEREWSVAQYLPPGVDPADPLVSPLFVADTRGLPPAHILCSHFDPLRNDSLRYTALLMAAGVEVSLTCYPDLIHGACAWSAVLASARAWREECIAALRRWRE